MDLIRQNKWLWVGIVLIFVVTGYTFGFFTSQSDLDNPRQSQTHIDHLLDEPLSLDTRAQFGTLVTKKKTLKRGAQWGSLKNMMKGKIAHTTDKKKKDKKDKKDDKKKDEEKKDKDEEKKEDEEKELDFEEDYYAQEEREEVEDDHTDTGSGLFPAAYARGGRLNNQTPTTVDDWISYLTGSPSLQKTNQFINEHQSGQVSANVFHPVVDALIESSVQEVKRFGFLALSSTPSLETFNHLVRISVSNHSADQKRSEDILKNYTEFQQLSVLMRAIHSPEDNIRLKVAVLAAESATRNLKPSEATAPKEGSNISSNTDAVLQANQLVSLKRQNQNESRILYESFRQQLQRLAQSDPNPQVRQQAEHAVGIIVGLLQPTQILE